jgi:hypothetical protein
MPRGSPEASYGLLHALYGVRILSDGKGMVWDPCQVVSLPPAICEPMRNIRIEAMAPPRQQGRNVPQGTPTLPAWFRQWCQLH